MDHVLYDRLEHLYRTFDLTLLSPDPLEIVRRFSSPGDQEVAGFIASALAYGRAEKIVETVDRVFRMMEDAPHDFVLHFDPKTDGGRFRSFVYRFSRGSDLIVLIGLLQRALAVYGSLQRLFLEGDRPEHPHIGPALVRFVDALTDGGSIPDLREAGSGARFFLPSPRSGSACKRLNLFLRWMVRTDGIDLGLWDKVSPARLIVPLDTHVARIARLTGLSDRRQTDWEMAEEVTQTLRIFDPCDPVKYDLSLCHWGMRQARGLDY
ncbi:MAG: TIGR02757 family protein [candidate division Zixibacteria bacterium]|nr:TIGR02757 family protein [candidate division Zixibacteria bacterium]